MDDERRHNPGRRDRDRLLDTLWRELDAVWKRLTAVEEKAERREERVDRRVDELEAFHAEERARTGERLRERAHTLERWQKWSIAIGAVGTVAGVAALLLTVIK